jgi:flagellin-like hook-associated protein FlgL
MRIAGGTILRRYMHNLERNMGNKNRQENKLYSGRGFNRASESPLVAARALRVRKAIADIKMYQDNLKTANMIYENAESSVMKVSALIQSTYEHLIKGAHGTLNDEDAAIVASSIDTFAEEMVQLMNIVVADRRIFGGVNNASRAFSIAPGGDGTRNVFYHGVSLNRHQDPNLYPYSGVSYADIGIGMGMGSNNRIDSQSAIPITFNGAKILGSGLDNKTTIIDLDSLTEGNYSFDVSVGTNRRTITFHIPAGSTNTQKGAAVNQALNAAFGGQLSMGAESGLINNHIAGRPEITVVNTPPSTGQPPFEQARITETASGFSANVIQLVLDSAQALKDDDRLLAAQFADALFALQTNVSLTLAEIGNMQEFIEFNLERTTNNMMSLLEQQRDLEASKPEEQITMIKVLEALFSAQLQMGANLLPMSIFNFIS